VSYRQLTTSPIKTNYAEVIKHSEFLSEEIPTKELFSPPYGEGLAFGGKPINREIALRRHRQWWG
jgi:hypothetical protein